MNLILPVYFMHWSALGIKIKLTLGKYIFDFTNKPSGILQWVAREQHYPVHTQ